jgi:hypothetical protein
MVAGGIGSAEYDITSPRRTIASVGLMPDLHGK